MSLFIKYGSAGISRSPYPTVERVPWLARGTSQFCYSEGTPCLFFSQEGFSFSIILLGYDWGRTPFKSHCR